MNFVIDNFKRLTTTPQNIEQLKKLVLQLAIQGKLTAKWRTDVQTRFIASTDFAHSPDYNAHALLEKIKAEKEQLIKEGKIKRDEPLPKITDDEKPFKLPKGWVWVRLGELINLTSGQDLPVDQYSDTFIDGIPYITGASNLYNGKVIINRWTQLPHSFAFKGDLLFTCKGAGIGKMAYLDVSVAHIARQIMSIRNIIISKLFLKFVLEINVDYYKSKAKSLIPGIDRSTIINTIFPLPPFAEQQEIVSTIEKLFAEIDQLQSLAQNKIILRENAAKALFGKINNPVKGEDIQQTWHQLTANFKTLTQSKYSVKQLRQTILQLAVQGKLTVKWREESPNVAPASVLLEKIKAEKEKLIQEGKIKREKSLPKISEVEKQFELPKSWSWIRLGAITLIKGGKRVPNTDKLSEIKTEHIYIRIRDMKNGTIVKNNLVYITNETFQKIKNYTISKNDLYITIGGCSINCVKFKT